MSGVSAAFTPTSAIPATEANFVARLKSPRSSTVNQVRMMKRSA